MTSESNPIRDALVRMADGTVKQRNLLTGTKVWTVSGRANRPLPSALPQSEPLDTNQRGAYCAFCETRYLETPPEKERIILEASPDANSPAPAAPRWQRLANLGADELFDTVAEFRRIPNLFEIVSYNYWLLNHQHAPTETQHRRMATYLASSLGYDHVMQVVKARVLAAGYTEQEFQQMNDSEKLSYANGFFSGGHDVIVARRHYVDGATETSQLASSGTLTPDEHFQYVKMTVAAMEDLYGLDPAVDYVATFQNWLRPAGASFDHLHKQLVAIDELPVQIEAEAGRFSANPKVYEEVLRVAATRRLLLAQNEHGVLMADFGHRYPTLAIWPLGPAIQPWEASGEQLRGISDLLHAAHAATGAQIPSNEEWYHRPPRINLPLRWRILLKWRISTLAGFEGGTRIYLNTLDPWSVQARVKDRLTELAVAGKIGPMAIGEGCKVTPEMLQ